MTQDEVDNDRGDGGGNKLCVKRQTSEGEISENVC